MAKSRPVVFAAVMAAGSASRFGTTKQLATLDGVPMVRRVTATARRAFGGRVVNVLGHDAAAVLTALGPDAGFAVVNDDYEQGLGSSIARAARSCPDTADALVIMMADQPLVSTAHLRHLQSAWSGSDNGIVATAFDSAVGPPVLFPRGAFGALTRLSGDSGARVLLDDARFEVRTLPFPAAAFDIDLPADLDAVCQEPLHLGDDL